MNDNPLYSPVPSNIQKRLKEMYEPIPKEVVEKLKMQYSNGAGLFTPPQVPEGYDIPTPLPTPEIKPLTQEKVIPEIRAPRPEEKVDWGKIPKPGLPEWSYRVSLEVRPLLKKVYGEKGLEELQKAQKRLNNVMGRAFYAPAIITGNWYFPLFMEGLNQVKNVIYNAKKSGRYSPLEIHMLSELLPKETPTPIKIASNLAENIADIALLNATANIAKQGLLKKTLEELANKLGKAGKLKEPLRVHKKDLVRFAKGTTLEREAVRYLKAKKLVIPKGKIGRPEAPSTTIQVKPQITSPPISELRTRLLKTYGDKYTPWGRISRLSDKDLANADKWIAGLVKPQPGVGIAPEIKAPTAQKQKPKVSQPDETKLKSMVEKAGGKWKGIQKLDDKNAYVVFNEPTSDSTAYLPIKQATPENISKKLAEIKQKFGKPKKEQVLYHVTTGIKGVGLGRLGEHEGKDISFTTDKNIATKIQKSLKRQTRIMRGELDFNSLRKEVLSERPEDIKLFDQAFSDLEKSYGKKVYQTPKYIEEAYQRFETYAEKFPDKPQVWIIDPEKLKQVNPDNIKILTAKVKRGAKPTRIGERGLKEVRYNPKDIIFPQAVKSKPDVISQVEKRIQETLKKAKAEGKVPLPELGVRKKSPLLADVIRKKGVSLEELREAELSSPPLEIGGFIRIPDNKEIQESLNRLASKIDIEKPFIDIGAPKTGFSIKNYFSRSEAERYRGAVTVDRLSKLKLTPDEYRKVTFIASQPTLFAPLSPAERKRLSPAYQLVRKFFDEHAKRLKKYNIIVEPWPQSLIKRLQNENLHLERTLKSAKGEEVINNIKEKIKDNKAIIRFLKKHKIKYVHLPLRVWLEDLFQNYPEHAPKVMRRFFRKRKTVDLRSLANYLIEQGIIKPEDTDIRNIIAAYSNKVGRMYSLSEIFLNAKKEGLVKPMSEAPADWVLPPAKLIPELRGYRVHPAFMEYLERFLFNVRKGYILNRPLGYIKLMQFDNPMFLGVYNIYQGIWLGSWRTPTLPKYVMRAVRSMAKKDDEYWNFLEYGGQSKPYLPPFDDFKKDIDILKETSFIKRAIKYIQQNLKVPTDAIYRPLWQIAWGFSDKFPRLVSYHYLRAKGYTPKEAAQLTALFHGDYASLPPEARKTLNKIFFTPVFKIVMSKAFFSMIKSFAKVVGRALLLKKSSKRDILLAQGLIVLIGSILGRRYLMKKLGFKEQDFGLRYVKEVEDEKGEKKELVVYIPTPDNVWLRYYHRWKGFPEDPDKLAGFINRAKWDLHPLWLLGVNLLQNRQPDGSPIWNSFDNSEKIAEDILSFSFKSLVRIARRIDDYGEKDKRKQQAIRALQKDVGKLWTTILAPTTLIYLRETKNRRLRYKLWDLRRQFLRLQRREGTKNLEERLKKLRLKMQEVLKEMGEDNED